MTCEKSKVKIDTWACVDTLIQKCINGHIYRCLHTHTHTHPVYESTRIHVHKNAAVTKENQQIISDLRISCVKVYLWTHTHTSKMCLCMCCVYFSNAKVCGLQNLTVSCVRKIMKCERASRLTPCGWLLRFYTYFYYA